MADYSTATICIGGPLRHSQVDTWMEVVGLPHLATELVETSDYLDDDACILDGRLFIHAAQARSGEFEYLETALVKQGVPFVRHTSMCHYWPEMVRVHYVTPEGVVIDISGESNESGDSFIIATRQVIDRYKEGGWEELQGHLLKHCPPIENPPPLEWVEEEDVAT